MNNDDYVRRRVYYEKEQPAPMAGCDRTVTVWATFTFADGLTIEGSDCVQWPLRDWDWTVRVKADQTRTCAVPYAKRSTWHRSQAH